MMNKDVGGRQINILRGGHKAHGGPPQSSPHWGKPRDGDLAIS